MYTPEYTLNGAVMSRGPGILQRAILDRLNGKGCQYYRGSKGGELQTTELCEELVHAGLVPENHQLAMIRVYRACRTLYWRGRIEVQHGITEGSRFCWSWKVKEDVT
jgi:hypothetical protein